MTVEAILPHGLQTSVYGSEYKAEYDANLALLDPDRITSGLLAARPTAGVARRFYFATDQNALYYDNGTAWVQQTASATALHATTHASGGNDALTLAQSQVTGLVADLAARAPATHSHGEGDVTGLVADLAAKAPLASPALTGTPTAQTAAPGTNTTQLATTGFVRAEKGIAGSTAGNIFRKVQLILYRDTSGANGIKCQTDSTGSGLSFNVSGNWSSAISGIFTKSGSASVGGGTTAVTYSLNANGNAVMIALVESISCILFSNINMNNGGTALNAYSTIVAGGINIDFRDSATGAAFDLTTLTNGKTLYLEIGFIVGGAE